MLKNKGFTLIEILISIGIIALVTAFVLPGFGDFTKRKRFEGVVNTFASEVSSIRSKALAGIRPEDSSRTVYKDDIVGLIYYCTSSNNPPSPYNAYVGDYYYLYRQPSTGATYFDGRFNLDQADDGDIGSDYRFECPGNPVIGWRYIYFDKFSGLGSTAEGEFSSTNSATVRIVMDSTGWSSDVVIYKTGVIDVN